MTPSTLSYKFVDAIPEKLDEGKLYIALEYATAVHKCCCGCGREVVTPLTPTDWKMTYDGVSVSLYPSIGNWNFPCKSHYWIDHNAVRWAEQWSDQRIAAGRMYDRNAKRRYFRTGEVPEVKGLPGPIEPGGNKPRKGVLAWLKSWWLNSS